MKKFLEFIKDTPTAFHAAKKFKAKLLAAGFIELKESEEWFLKRGGKYFYGRNMSSLMAFVIPEEPVSSFSIAAAHLDSPTFKLKPNFTIDKGRYVRLNTEVYGSPIFSTWMDKPLGIAGRVIIEEDMGLEARLVNITKPLVVIPNLPIHYNRNANSGFELNPQIDMLPLFSDNKFPKKGLYDVIGEALGIDSNKIISSDLYLTNLDRGSFVGVNEEFVTAPQIDNLECSYALIESLINSKSGSNVNVCALFDNEEIGSGTRQGAFSNYLNNTLKRICLGLGYTEEKYLQILANSFIISADNAQGYHPNYPSKYDETNSCYMNEGIVIKNAARGSYSTDALSSAFFQKICKKANASYQLNTNRSDIAGGSTLGPISIRNVSIPSVDIGLAQLAMHSASETSGSLDIHHLISAITFFYNLDKYVSKEATFFLN